MTLDKPAGAMARIAVITHECDRFQVRRGWLLRRDSRFMLFDLLEEQKRRGHSVRILSGTSARPEADIAVLHVDATVTPEAYVEYAGRFPFCLNNGAVDIAKRSVSTAVVGRGDAWKGEVVVKEQPQPLGSAGKATEPAVAPRRQARTVPGRGGFRPLPCL